MGGFQNCVPHFTPGTPIYRTPVHFKQINFFSYRNLCVRLKPSQLTDSTVTILNCCLVLLFHNVKFVKLILVFLIPRLLGRLPVRHLKVKIIQQEFEIRKF
jgi:hypothetical protein